MIRIGKHNQLNRAEKTWQSETYNFSNAYNFSLEEENIKSFHRTVRLEKIVIHMFDFEI